jgi:hypothetical protein
MAHHEGTVSAGGGHGPILLGKSEVGVSREVEQTILGSK